MMTGDDESQTDTGKGSDKRGKQDEGIGRRKYLEAAAIGATGVSLSGCLGVFGSSEDNDGITIGVLSYEDHPAGTGISQAAELAVDHLNENDGVLGGEVELLTRDTEGDPSQGQTHYQELVLDNGVDATVGVYSSEVLQNLMEDIASQQTIHLTSGAATTAPSEMIREDYDQYKYHFRPGVTNEYHVGLVQLDFLEGMYENLGWESIAVLVEDYQWTEAIWDLFEERLDEIGPEIAYSSRYSGDTDDYSPLYNDVANSGADAAFVTMAHTGAPAAIQWAQDQRPFAFGGVNVPMQLPTLYQDTEGAFEYGITQTYATADTAITDETIPFAESYIEANGSDPVYTGYTTYDAIMVYAAAVEEAETTDSEELVNTLEGISYTGATGNIEFYGQDEDYPHDQVYGEDNVRSVYFQWQEDDGEPQQQVIWPQEHATGEYETPEWMN